MLAGGARVKAVKEDVPSAQSLRSDRRASTVGVIPFDGESAALSDEAEQQIQRVVAQIQNRQERVEIRGHAGARPLSAESAMRDKYDLAYERCREVMRSLVQQGIDPERIRHYVAADHEPLDEEIDGRQDRKNSRVQIVLRDEGTAVE
jgi:flagellar motor protein MotB